MKPVSPVLVSLSMCALVACSSQPAGTTKAPETPVASIASTTHAETEVAAGTSKSQRSPRSEEALVQVVARALGSRDLTALQACATPEFAADLRRMHDQDPAGFWIRGSAFVQNVKTGFEVLHRQEDTRDQWNIVVRFGNGHEERLTFTREGGKLRFADL